MRNLFRLIVKNYFILLFVLLEGLSLLFIFQFNPYQKSVFVNFSRNLNGAIYSQFGTIREYLALKKENDFLHLENTRLRNELSRLPRVEKQVNPDTVITDTVSGRWQYYFIPADVINNSYNKQYNYLTLNKGRKQGVEKDMAVISNGGVTGIVAGVSDNFATVIPVLNRNFRVGSKIERNDYFGILQWEGDSPLSASLNEIPLHVEVEKGDRIVTSGFSAIFPPGIPVGEVEDIKVDEGNFYTISVSLFVDFRNLKHVNVIGNIYQEEKNTLENSLGYD